MKHKTVGTSRRKSHLYSLHNKIDYKIASETQKRNKEAFDNSYFGKVLRRAKSIGVNLGNSYIKNY